MHRLVREKFGERLIPIPLILMMESYHQIFESGLEESEIPYESKVKILQIVNLIRYFIHEEVSWKQSSMASFAKNHRPIMRKWFDSFTDAKDIQRCHNIVRASRHHPKDPSSFRIILAKLVFVRAYNQISVGSKRAGYELNLITEEKVMLDEKARKLEMKMEAKCWKKISSNSSLHQLVSYRLKNKENSFMSYKVSGRVKGNLLATVDFFCNVIHSPQYEKGIIRMGRSRIEENRVRMAIWSHSLFPVTKRMRCCEEITLVDLKCGVVNIIIEDADVDLSAGYQKVPFKFSGMRFSVDREDPSYIHFDIMFDYETPRSLPSIPFFRNSIIEKFEVICKDCESSDRLNIVSRIKHISSNVSMPRLTPKSSIIAHSFETNCS
eukprot:TRINITY_DN5465_c0_g1_i4.p1 TRINITY_DN5465_c0_g1~~TRINITY_DN5465_c0_g1_i4.p1  ORF type:complete len:380 (-),score=109.57 TRINITY_DN5465_c0_g1_i4:1014-2153(-)